MSFQKKKLKVETRGVATRYKPEKPLQINTKTIGTPFNYDFDTCNISKSGVLMTSSRKNIPFRKNTIVEMTIDPDGDWFGAPVSVIGKIVRRDDHGDESNTDLGVSIISMDGSDEERWNSCINTIAVKSMGIMTDDAQTIGLTGPSNKKKYRD